MVPREWRTPILEDAYEAALCQIGFDRVFEEAGQPEACSGGVHVPWGPLGMGYLTGTIDARTPLDPKTDFRSGFERFSPENLTANRPIVDLLAKVAERKGASRAQVALAWLLAQKPWIVPIPGTRRVDHLEENLGATRLELTATDLRELESGLASVDVHGRRMSAKYMAEVEE